MAADLVSATLNGAPVNAKALDAGKIGQASFRSQSVVLTAPQRIRIRSVMSEAGLNVKSGEEAQAVPALLSKLNELARAAGGPAPAPAPPTTLHLEEIRNRSGNEQLLEIFNQSEQLLGQIQAWSSASETLKARLPRWQTAQRLLHHAQGLAVAEQAAPQLDAVQEHRTLLRDPDPVQPIIGELVSSLREELASRYRHLVHVYATQMQQLVENPTWKELPATEARDILMRNGLAEPKEPELGTEVEVLAALDHASLVALDNRAHAIQGRCAQALQEAATFLEPRAVPLQMPKTTLKNHDEATAYLEKLREVIFEYLDDGHPVVI
jgi:hypothetical protein